MPPPPATLLRYLRRLATPPGPAPESDAALLAHFARDRDEAAFAALAARHGPMVLSVCRHVLGDAHAAEDCAQAAFLVLARKAASLRRPQALAAWLHGVTLRVARQARAEARRRPGPVGPAAPEPADPRPDPLDALAARELLELLDEEIARLPETYRLPVLLCGREGRTQEEAAVLLDWTPGSVRGRLERGRKRLHDRLARRGLTLAAVLRTAEVARGVSSAAGSLTAAAAKAATLIAAGKAVPSAKAAALSEGVFKAMVPAKLKVAAAVLLATAVAAVAGGTALFHARAAQPPDKGRADRQSSPIAEGTGPAAADEPDAKAGAATDEDPALNHLIRSLGEGPIRVRPAAPGAGAASEEEAVKAAKRAVGVGAPPDKAWRVAVTDREFMSGLLDDKPCWLLYYPDAVQLPLSFEGKDARTLGLYVVVDAAAGRLWEAFTEPEAPWWNGVREKKNEELVRAYADRGDEAAANPDLPGVPLLRLLNARAQGIPDLPNGQEYGAQRKARQVVARHFLYTTPVDTEEQTEKGVRRFRSHDREPVWAIEFDGVDLPPPVGPPGPDADLTPDGPKARKEERPNVERIEVLWDATSGRCLSTGMSP